jgi:L-arabinose isomerase
MKSKAPDSKLTGNQMFYKVKQLKQYSSQLEKEVARLKQEAKKKKTVTKGVVLSDREVNEIIDLMENSEREVYHSNPDENSGDLWE